MERNIPILYVLACLGNVWVWLAIWALYYLLFTDYAGIGIIEALTWFTVTLIEIPSGAIADLWGKKRAIVVSYILIGSGNIFMFFADGIWLLAASAVVIAIGLAFLSGAFEALTYDSLKESGREDEYEKVYSKQKSIILFTHVIASLVGGIIYVQFSPGLPFVITGLLAFSAAILALFLVEPHVKHNLATPLKSVWQQNNAGFAELFKNKKLQPYTYLFLLIGLVPVFMYEYVAELTLIEKGATPEQMGIFVTAILLSAAVATYFTPFITKRIGHIRAYVLIGFVYAALMLAVPTAGLWLVVVFNIFWASTSVIRQVIESKEVNDHTSPENRATTLSTLSMLRYLPYSTTVVFIGYFADKLSMEVMVLYLGLIMALLCIVAVFQYKIRSVS